MINNKSFIVGLVMRLQPYRRFDLVIETAKRIKASGKNIIFLILGRGKARIVKQIKESSEKVWFVEYDYIWWLQKSGLLGYY